MTCLTSEQLLQAAVEASPLHLLRTYLADVGSSPDDWQVQALTDPTRRLMVTAGRQVGKSAAAAAKALHHAAHTPGELVLLVSASERQARELLARMRSMLPYLGQAAEGVEDSQSAIRFPSGSRIVVLPSTSSSLRGWTANLLIVDEAAWVSRAAWDALLPTIAATGGAVVVITSASAPAGWAWELWSERDRFPEWVRIEVPAASVPRISREFLEQERRRLPKAVFEQEYCCVWTAPAGAAFDPATVAAAFDTAAGEGPETPPAPAPAAGKPAFDWAELDLTDLLTGEI